MDDTCQNQTGSATAEAPQNQGAIAKAFYLKNGLLFYTAQQVEGYLAALKKTVETYGNHLSVDAQEDVKSWVEDAQTWLENGPADGPAPQEQKAA